MTLWFLLPAAYLIGSIPFSVYLVRWATGRDVRRAGSGNPGATNALRIAGPRVGLLTLLCDVLKGVLPVALARILGVGALGLGGIAIAVVLGHVYSLFLRLRGGKGVATAAGALGALAPLVLVGVVSVFIGVVLATRYVSLASVAGALSFPFIWWGLIQVGWLPSAPWELLTSALVVAWLIAFKHSSNLARIRRGVERRLGELKIDDGVGLDGAHLQPVGLMEPVRGDSDARAEDLDSRVDGDLPGQRSQDPQS